MNKKLLKKAKSFSVKSVFTVVGFILGVGATFTMTVWAVQNSALSIPTTAVGNWVSDQWNEPDNWIASDKIIQAEYLAENLKYLKNKVDDIQIGAVNNLRLGAHSSADCTAASGVVKTISDGTKLCEFTGSSCRSGWTAFENYGSQGSRTCRGTHTRGGGCFAARFAGNRTNCTTPSSNFSNTPIKTCRYRNTFGGYPDEYGGCGFSVGWGTSATCVNTFSSRGCY